MKATPAQRAEPVTPRQAYDAANLNDTATIHYRVRYEAVHNDGRVTRRHDGKMHDTGVDRTHARTPVLMLIQDLDIHIINATTREFLRQLTLDTSEDYQPQNKKSPEP